MGVMLVGGVMSVCVHVYMCVYRGCMCICVWCMCVCVCTWVGVVTCVCLHTWNTMSPKVEMLFRLGNITYLVDVTPSNSLPHPLSLSPCVIQVQKFGC